MLNHRNSYVTPRAGRREWLALAAIALPCMLYSMDLTVLNLALPRIAADLGPSSTQVLWIVDVYGFVIGGFLITMGALGDRIGRRRLLLTGAAAFGAASVLAAFATSATALIAARAILGVAGATLAPSTLSLIRALFLDPRQQVFAIGLWAASYSAGGAIGPLLGGVMIEHLWWGSVFLIGVPVMLVLLLVGPSLLPEVKAPDAGPLDLPSAAMALSAVLLAVQGIKTIATGGSQLAALALIGAGIGVGALFVHRQRVLAEPMISLQLFRAPGFVPSLLTNALGMSVVFGLYVNIAQYLQLVLGLSPARAGLWTLPSSAGFVVGSLLVPIVAARLRPGTVIAAGLVIASVGVWTMGAVGGLVGVVLGSTIFSLGTSSVPTLATAMIVGSAPAHEAGAASGVAETSSELGGALGIALLGSLGAALYRARLDEDAPSTVETLASAVGLAADHVGSSAPWLDAARDAFVYAFTTTSYVSAAVLLATAALVFALLRKVPAGH